MNRWAARQEVLFKEAIVKLLVDRQGGLHGQGVLPRRTRQIEKSYLVGAKEGGVKELLGMELSYRKSTESCSGVLRSCATVG